MGGWCDRSCRSAPTTASIAHLKGVIARLDRTIQYSAPPVIKHEGRDVLDHPLSRMMTAEYVAGALLQGRHFHRWPRLSATPAKTRRGGTGGRSGRAPR